MVLLINLIMFSIMLIKIANFINNNLKFQRTILIQINFRLVWVSILLSEIYKKLFRIENLINIYLSLEIQ
jgi:hypothetical protein